MPPPVHPAPCPECGAQPRSAKTCTDQYHACLALEYSDPGYGQVHHFTVLAYMLQHPGKLSAAGWQAMRQLLAQFLTENISPAHMRQRLQGQMAQKSFSMVKGEPAARPTWTWTKTIMDVRLDNPETYCADVRAWAESVHNDIQQHEEVT